MVGDNIVACETVLLSELAARGLHFVVGMRTMTTSEPLSVDVLIAGLVQHEDARLHMALIALFLYQPETATAVLAALSLLNHVQQCRLKLFYTAATLLQRVHRGQLCQYIPNYRSLPDLFAGSLGLELAAPPKIQLQQLSDRHQELSGMTTNWLGSYNYAAERLLTRLAKETAWAA